MNIPKVAIIGRPNAGKSTLFNRLAGERRVITSSTPGTTRDRVSAKISWDGKDFLLIDTAGIISETIPQGEEIESMAQKQVIESLRESDLILFVIDGKVGLTPQDTEASKTLREFSKKVVVVANKLDDRRQEKQSTISDLGFSDNIDISAITGRRCGDLLDKIAKRLPLYKAKKPKLPVMTIIGRPNVGKSTLFNTLVGSGVSIVSPVAGTTRDSVEVEVSNRRGQGFIVLDTAGYRRRGKIKPGIERFSIYRVLDAIVRSDLVLVVIDTSEGITRQDAHLVQLALDHKKKVVVVANKIDKLKNESTEEIENYYRYEFILRNKVVGISALKKKNINYLLKEIETRLFT